MNEYKTIPLNKINCRDARLAVIGLGYVGLPLAVEFAKADFRTIGPDLDLREVEVACCNWYQPQEPQIAVALSS